MAASPDRFNCRCGAEAQWWISAYGFAAEPVCSHRCADKTAAGWMSRGAERVTATRLTAEIRNRIRMGVTP